MSRRDRHGRGLRGPLAARNPITNTVVPVPQPPRGAARFAQYLQLAVRRGEAACPRAYVGIDIGFEEVPANLVGWWSDQVPLAVAQAAGPGRPAAVVLFRRPLEHRASSPGELQRLVHRTLVEQLAALTGISISELDPTGETGEWDD